METKILRKVERIFLGLLWSDEGSLRVGLRESRTREQCEARKEKGSKRREEEHDDDDAFRTSTSELPMSFKGFLVSCVCLKGSGKGRNKCF